jgi:hypothetical protein
VSDDLYAPIERFPITPPRMFRTVATTIAALPEIMVPGSGIVTEPAVVRGSVVSRHAAVSARTTPMMQARDRLTVLNV